MSKIKNFAKTLWSDESGQGTAEYILLMAIIVGVLVMFGGPLKEKMKTKWEAISGQMDEVTK